MYGQIIYKCNNIDTSKITINLKKPSSVFDYSVIHAYIYYETKNSLCVQVNTMSNCILNYDNIECAVIECNNKIINVASKKENIINIMFDKNQKNCVELFECLKNLDNFFESLCVKKILFEEDEYKYNYEPIIKSLDDVAYCGFRVTIDSGFSIDTMVNNKCINNKFTIKNAKDLIEALSTGIKFRFIFQLLFIQTQTDVNKNLTYKVNLKMVVIELYD
jgi:hypothetical protein